jgi:hypothetical protein
LKHMASGRPGLARCSAPGRRCAVRAYGFSCITTKAVSGPLIPRKMPGMRAGLAQPRRSGFRPHAGHLPGGGPESLRCPRSCGRCSLRCRGRAGSVIPGQPVLPIESHVPLNQQSVPGSSGWLHRKPKQKPVTSCGRLEADVQNIRSLSGQSSIQEARSSSVLCTRAALRRPSVWLIMLHNEGCFRATDPPEMPGS